MIYPKLTTGQAALLEQIAGTGWAPYKKQKEGEYGFLRHLVESGFACMCTAEGQVPMRGEMAFHVLILPDWRKPLVDRLALFQEQSRARLAQAQADRVQPSRLPVDYVKSGSYEPRVVPIRPGALDFLQYPSLQGPLRIVPKANWALSDLGCIRV